MLSMPSRSSRRRPFVRTKHQRKPVGFQKLRRGVRAEHRPDPAVLVGHEAGDLVRGRGVAPQHVPGDRRVALAVGVAAAFPGARQPGGPRGEGSKRRRGRGASSRGTAHRAARTSFRRSARRAAALRAHAHGLPPQRVPGRFGVLRLQLALVPVHLRAELALVVPTGQEHVPRRGGFPGERDGEQLRAPRASVHEVAVEDVPVRLRGSPAMDISFSASCSWPCVSPTTTTSASRGGRRRNSVGSACSSAPTCFISFSCTALGNTLARFLGGSPDRLFASSVAARNRAHAGVITPSPGHSTAFDMIRAFVRTGTTPSLALAIRSNRGSDVRTRARVDVPRRERAPSASPRSKQ